jgi:predicted RNA binding protein YcfA (HicA-like mRNA interferase family)
MKPMIVFGGCQTLKGGRAFTGNMEIPQGDSTNMGDLPIEMVELILCNLSWPDLAPLSSTCSAFKSASCQVLSLDQERRCDLAVARFGRGRINWIADLISRSLRVETLSRENGVLETGSSWICPNGEILESAGHPDPPIPLNAKEMCLTAIGWGVHMDLVPQRGSHIFVRTCRKRKMARISVYPHSNEDLAGVALLQELLNGDLAPTLLENRAILPLPGNVGAHLDIRIVGYSWDVGITQAGLRVQIAHLLPFASHHISASQETCIPTAIGERMTVHFRT